MANFVPLKRAKDVPMGVVPKAALTTDIEAWDFITIDANGLAVRADATATQLAYVQAVNNTENTVTVEAGSDVVYQGKADAPFAESNRNTEVDIAIGGSSEQLIDLWASSTDCLKVVSTIDAGTVGSADKVLVKINNPIAL